MHKPLLVGSLVTSILAGCGGGCPWTHASKATATPSMSCLTLSVADGSGTAPSTGCVDPVLYGTNSCADDLVLPASDAANGAAVTVAAGTSFTYEVAGDQIHDRQVSIQASVGGTTVTIDFSLSGGYL